MRESRPHELLSLLLELLLELLRRSHALVRLDGHWIDCPAFVVAAPSPIDHLSCSLQTSHQATMLLDRLITLLVRA
jgi:hypothetical protein